MRATPESQQTICNTDLETMVATLLTFFSALDRVRASPQLAGSARALITRCRSRMTETDVDGACIHDRSIRAPPPDLVRFSREKRDRPSLERPAPSMRGWVWLLKMWSASKVEPLIRMTLCSGNRRMALRYRTQQPSSDVTPSSLRASPAGWVLSCTLASKSCFCRNASRPPAAHQASVLSKSMADAKKARRSREESARGMPDTRTTDSRSRAASKVNSRPGKKHNPWVCVKSSS